MTVAAENAQAEAPLEFSRADERTLLVRPRLVVNDAAFARQRDSLAARPD